MKLLVAAVCLAVAHGVQEAQPPVSPEPKWDDLHPTLKIDVASAHELFDNGLADSKKRKDDNWVWERARCGIGGESRLWGLFAWVVLYDEGFRAGKQYWPESKVREARALIDSGCYSKPTKLCFKGRLVVNALKVDSAGRNGIEDVHVVLKVGDRIYQPDKPLGRLQGRSITGEVEDTKIVTHTATDKDGKTTTTYSTVPTRRTFHDLCADFEVEFSLFDENGDARITKADKELVVLVVCGSNERRAVYSLGDGAKTGR